eukprot:SM000179S03415  [mRNA]  locus=s179:199945:203415:- [translate_table: standard]
MARHPTSQPLYGQQGGHQSPGHKVESEYRDDLYNRQAYGQQLHARHSQGHGHPQMRSEYMTADEVDNILRMQWAATHATDPYVDDYYHQAAQAKQLMGTQHGRRHFAPSQLRDYASHTRPQAEPHAYLQVEGLGRVPFSSIRRPRPLLEVDQGPGVHDPSWQRPLEQEPMLAARIAIEDGMSLLLEVDDIDRLLSHSQAQGQYLEANTQLRRRRQLLLEGLATSLQLHDPLMSIGGNPGGFKDDPVFLRLVSLPKGRKLVARYLQLLPPGSNLLRVVIMAVLRHLRFLFGGPQNDPSRTSTSANLANAVATALSTLDLSALSACLAAVVIAPEQPHLQDLPGDGATLILRTLLERATAILTDRSAASAYRTTGAHRSMWQASFDAFFQLLCSHLLTADAFNQGGLDNKSVPLELIRSSLPHTNEQQRASLLEITQRTVAMGNVRQPSASDAPGISATSGPRGVMRSF